MGGLCRRCRTRGGTASCFIGEKSPFDTVHQYGAEAACDCLAQTECFLKNAGKNAWKLADHFGVTIDYLVGRSDKRG